MNHSLLAITSIVFSFSAQAAFDCSHFAVISHRGLSGLLPEESRDSYLASADIKADYLEMDVHRTKDQVLILNHDNTFARTTDIQKVFPIRANDLISTFTYDEVLKLKNRGVPIIKLEDAIQISLTHPNHPGLYMETKSPELYPGIEKQMVDLLEAKGAFKQVKVFFQSFDIDSIKRFKELRPEVPRLYLSEASYQNILKTDLPLATQFANGIGANLEDIGEKRLQAFIAKVHQLKLVFHPYTVDEPKRMKILIEANADGVFTNRTDLLIEICGKIAASEIKAKLSPYVH